MSVSERRPTPSEREHELAMQIAGRGPAQPESSVTISRNAKGVAQFEVVVRDTTPATAETTARKIFDALVTAYPYPEGTA